ncbi:ATPase, T2SS/T4P/T4SS family [soil metagenome]
MTPQATIDGAPTNPLVAKMVHARQLSAQDAEAFVQSNASATSFTEEDVLRWLAAEYGVPYNDLTQISPDRELLSLFPARVLLKEHLLPIGRVGDVIEMATSSLFITEGLDTLRNLTGKRIRPVLAPLVAIQREMKARLGVGADTLDTLDDQAGIEVIDEFQTNDEDLDSAAENASIIRFVNQVFSDAIALRATDIHLEPFEDEMRIRYRIDGILQDVPVPPSIKRFQPAIVSRIKILSHLDIAEKRLPQDGRIKVRLEAKEVDVRVSLIPMLYGEGVVMRLLRKDIALHGLDDMGMAEREAMEFRRLLQIPHGIVLVTGPTGSGKSTTLYAALGEINDSIRKIITVEDPIEYHVKGVNQIQVNEKSGLTFPRALRAILRHDPDVVLIGEIRDAETAHIAVQASLTGHLVFSTLHTNDAASAPTRLIDMGVEPYLVAASLSGVMAQRLVRILCPHCKAEDTSAPAMALKEDIGLKADHPIFKPVGCEHCRRTGYQGRRAIFELMLFDEHMRELVLKSRSISDLRDTSRTMGMNLLAEDGWRLVAAGITTPDEVLRVTHDERKSGRR